MTTVKNEKYYRSDVPRMDSKMKAAWVHELRTTTMPQTKRALYILDEDNSMGQSVGQCCLGVFTEVCIKQGFTPNLSYGDARGMRMYGEEANSGTLPIEIQKRAWGDNYRESYEITSLHRGEVFQIRENRDEGLLRGGYTTQYLSALNDSGKFTFKQIADIVDYFL